jgi:mannose-6-phosphate isomerase class I
VPSGTIHALTKGLLVLEIQQPIDLTYRLYDYGRHSSKRLLHISECINSSNIPFTDRSQINTNELHTRFFDIHIIKNKFVTYYNFKNAK